jgi:hypothetical protein
MVILLQRNINLHGTAGASGTIPLNTEHSQSGTTGSV